MEKNRTGLLPSIPLSKMDSVENTSKLVQEKKMGKENEIDAHQMSERLDRNLKIRDMGNIGKYTSDRIQDIVQMMEDHPDIELASQILVSSILSPNDLLTTSLYYESSSAVIPHHLSTLLCEYIEKEIESKYKLAHEMNAIVKEALVTTGSYSRLIIPGSKLNTMVTDATDISLESFADKQADVLMSGTPDIDTMLKHVSFISDPSILNLATEYNDVITGIQSEGNNISVESIGAIVKKKNKNKAVEELFKTLTDTKKEYIDLSTHELPTERCFTMKIPAEAVIPLHFSSDPSKHFGYYILLDGKGSPLVGGISESNGFDSKKIMSQIITKAKEGLNRSTQKAPKLENVDDTLSIKINKKITDAIVNKVGNVYITEADRELLLRTVLHRVLKAKQTKLLYVPVSQLSYYAFDYRVNGTGKPILDNLGIISSLRSIVKFSKISSFIRNSIPTTNVDVTLDDNDPDAPKRIEEIRAFVMENRALSLPIGLNKSTDVVDWLHKYGFSFNFKHVDLPNMEIGFDERSTSYVAPEEDLDEELRKSIFMKMGLSPESVDNSHSADFAATILSQNVLQAKRIMMRQSTLNPQIKNDVVRLVKNDGVIYKGMVQLIQEAIPNLTKVKHESFREHFKRLNLSEKDVLEYIIEDFLTSLTVSLPQVEVAENGSKESFDAFKDSVDDYIESYLSEDALPNELAGNITDNIDILQQSVKHTLMRRWMKKNNYLPELADLFSISEVGEMDMSILTEYNTFLKNLGITMSEFIKANVRDQESLDKAIKVDDEPGDDA